MSIISTRLLISDKRRQFLDLKIGNQMMQKVTRMETTQVCLIAANDRHASRTFVVRLPRKVYTTSWKSRVGNGNARQQWYVWLKKKQKIVVHLRFCKTTTQTFAIEAVWTTQPFNEGLPSEVVPLSFRQKKFPPSFTCTWKCTHLLNKKARDLQLCLEIIKRLLARELPTREDWHGPGFFQ